MKQNLILLLMLLGMGAELYSQGAVLSTNPTATPNASSMFQVDGTSGGILIPQLTAAQRQTLGATAAQGLWVYQTDEHPGLYQYNDSSWVRMSSTRSVSGKATIDYADSTLQAVTPGPYTITQSAFDSGVFTVAFTPGTFSSIPSITITSNTLPPLVTIDPYSYCPLEITNHCATCGNTCQDYLDDCVATSYPLGVLNGAFGFSDMNSGCDGAPNGFVDNFNTHTLVIDAQASSYYRLQIQSSPNWANNVYSYIDWNQDAELDSGELVYSATNPSPNDQVFNSGNLTAPPGAFNGTTLLRVISTYALPATACSGTFPLTWGESHNYRVVVQNGVNASALDKAPRSSVCSTANVSSSGFRVFCTDLNDNRIGTSWHFYATEN